MTTEQNLGKLLTMLYNDGVFLEGDFDAAIEKSGLILSANERIAVIHKAKLDDLIDFDYKGKKDDTEKFNIELSETGKKILDKHKTYKKYLLSEKKTKQADFIDRSIKNGNLIAAIIIAAGGLVLALSPINNKKQQQRIEEGIQSIATQLDSLKKAVQYMQPKSVNSTKQDTATNK